MSEQPQPPSVRLHTNGNIDLCWPQIKGETIYKTYGLNQKLDNGVIVLTTAGSAHITEFDVWYPLVKEGE